MLGLWEVGWSGSATQQKQVAEMLGWVVGMVVGFRSCVAAPNLRLMKRQGLAHS